MLTSSSNQYLRPEYLTPLPTTLDAKKTPLALLAQTCSQIGAEPSNSKLIQREEKTTKTKPESSKDKSSPGSAINSNDSLKATFKPYDTCQSREKTRSPEERTSSTGSRVRTPITSKNNVSGNGNGRCNSNQSVTSPRESPAAPERRTPASENNDTSREQTTPAKNNDESSTPHVPSTSSSKMGFTSSILTSTTDHSIKDLPLGTFKPGTGIPTTTGFFGGYPPPGMAIPMDLMTSTLMSHHALKAGALSPYLNYARIKGVVNSDSLLPPCRGDPFCTGCMSNSHLLATSSAAGKTTPCPAGCTQCDHAKTASAYLGHNSAAALYAHALAAASQWSSNQCSWMTDGSCCGKFFSSSEDLLQHLRTHAAAATTSEANSALNMLRTAGLPSPHPLLHRTYPTPPLSPLATARYHPYSKPSLMPSSLPPTLSSFPFGHVPGIPAYLSPYSLYGPRLGAAPGMHP